MHALPEVLIQLRYDDLRREADQARLALSVPRPPRRTSARCRTTVAVPWLRRRPA